MTLTDLAMTCEISIGIENPMGTRTRWRPTRCTRPRLGVPDSLANVHSRALADMCARDLASRTDPVVVPHRETFEKGESSRQQIVTPMIDR